MNVRISFALIVSLIGLYQPTIAQTEDLTPEFSSIHWTGPPSNRVDMMTIGEAYPEDPSFPGEGRVHPQFVAETDLLVTDFFTPGGPVSEPFTRYGQFFNVHRIDVTSVDSNLDSADGSMLYDTALNGYFEEVDGGTWHHLRMPKAGAELAVERALSNAGIGPSAQDSYADLKIAFFNDDGRSNASINEQNWAHVIGDGSESTARVTKHELGHSFAKLSDEYVEGVPHSFSPNVFYNNTCARWARWDGHRDPLYNTPGQYGYGTPIGCYTGAAGSPRFFRPSLNSAMRWAENNFDAVGREAIIAEIYETVDPLDIWRPESDTLDNAKTAWVKTVDPDVVDVRWFLNGAEVTGDFVPSTEVDVLAISSLNLADGTYTLEARAFDRVLNHAYSSWNPDNPPQNPAKDAALDWWRGGEDGEGLLIGDLDLSGTVDATDWQILIGNFDNSGSDELAGFLDGNLNTDQVIDSTDLGLLINQMGKSGTNPLVQSVSWTVSIGSIGNAVPEPRSISLIAFVLVAFGMRFRRTR